MLFWTLCIAALSLCTLTSSRATNDILYLNDWTFDFNLEREADWNHHYAVTTDNNRRFLAEQDYENYDDSTNFDGANAWTKQLSGSARSCTDTIPGIFHKLCVHWTGDDGFKLGFEADSNDANNRALDWYYGSRQRTAAARREAENVYNGLAGKSAHFSDDNEWDSVDLVDGLLHEMMNSDELYDQMMDVYHKYASGRSVRKCGLYKAGNMRMCAMYNPYTNQMSVKMQLPHARFVRHDQEEEAAPANFQALMLDDEDNTLDEVDFAEEEMDNYLDDEDYADEYADDYAEYDEDYDEDYAYDDIDEYYDDEYADEYYLESDDEEAYGEYYGDYYADEEYEGADGDYYNGVYMEDDFYDDAESADAENLEEWWDYNYGSKLFDNNNIFDAEKFEFGDALGLEMHDNEELDWQRTKCINCDSVSFAQQEEEDMYNAAAEETAGDDAVDIGYDAYGDYVYFFDDRQLDWNDDSVWTEERRQGDILTKCASNIPGLDHKLCVDKGSDFTVRFEASSKAEIDNSYFEQYGYDEYYYNMQDDEGYDDEEEYGNYYDSADDYEDEDAAERAIVARESARAGTASAKDAEYSDYGDYGYYSEYDDEHDEEDEERAANKARNKEYAEYSEGSKDGNYYSQVDTSDKFSKWDSAEKDDDAYDDLADQAYGLSSRSNRASRYHGRAARDAYDGYDNSEEQAEDMRDMAEINRYLRGSGPQQLTQEQTKDQLMRKTFGHRRHARRHHYDDYDSRRRLAEGMEYYDEYGYLNEEEYDDMDYDEYDDEYDDEFYGDDQFDDDDALLDELYDEYFDEYYNGGEYDDVYDDSAFEDYYDSLYDEEAHFEEDIRNDLSSVALSFLKDGHWDSVHRVDSLASAQKEYSRLTPYSAAKVYDGEELQKCRTFQTAQVCATTRNSQEPNFRVNVRVGAHKHFKLTEEAVQQQYAALREEFGDELDEADTFDALMEEEGDDYAYDDEFADYDDAYEDELYDDEEDDFDEAMDDYYYVDEEAGEDMDSVDTFFDAEHSAEWVVTNEVTNEYDSEWEDDSQWTDVDEVVTYSAHRLTKKCMDLFGRKLCLCEFVGFVTHQKHVCHPGKARKVHKMHLKLKRAKAMKKKKQKQLRRAKMKRLKKIAAMKRRQAAKEKKRIRKEEAKIAQRTKIMGKENKANQRLQKELKKYRRKIKKLRKRLRAQKRKNKQRGHGHGHGHHHHHHHHMPPHNMHNHRRHWRLNHPHHHRHFHLHVHPHIPWKRYRHHAKDLPEKRPKWLPKWIWRELGENFKALEMEDNTDSEYYEYAQQYFQDYDDASNDYDEQGISSAFAAMEDYDDEYAYDEDAYDDFDDAEYDDMDNEYYDDEYADYADYDDAYEDYGDQYANYDEYYGDAEDVDVDVDEVSLSDLQDQWVDEEDGSAWIVSRDAVDEYDSEWEDDQEWDEVNSAILTNGGKRLTRKCMHMWGRRLCLCQFLGWMDNHKYKCTTTSVSESALDSPTYRQPPQAAPWVHSLKHEKRVEIPKKITSKMHISASVKHNNKKSAADLKVEKEHAVQMAKKKAMREEFGDALDDEDWHGRRLFDGYDAYEDEEYYGDMDDEGYADYFDDEDYDDEYGQFADYAYDDADYEEYDDAEYGYLDEEEYDDMNYDEGYDDEYEEDEDEADEYFSLSASDLDVDVSDKLADEWHDAADAADWTVLSAEEKEFDAEWQDDSLWDEVSGPIRTVSGHSMQRKCMNLFGRKLCLCEFINWVKFGTTKHQCGRKQGMVAQQKSQVVSEKKRILRKIKKLVKKKHKMLRKEHAKQKADPTKIAKLQKQTQQLKQKAKATKAGKKSPLKPVAVKKGGAPKTKKIKLKPVVVRKLKKAAGTVPAKGKVKLQRLIPKQKKKLAIPPKKLAQMRKMVRQQQRKPFHLKMRRGFGMGMAEKLRMRSRMMKRLRGDMPAQRPNWLPHYFWHWLHHGHRHRFHHGPRHGDGGGLTL